MGPTTTVVVGALVSSELDRSISQIGSMLHVM